MATPDGTRGGATTLDGTGVVRPPPAFAVGGRPPTVFMLLCFLKGVLFNFEDNENATALTFGSLNFS
ncbi:MAG: hypothetical protein O7C59_08915 [Rickettsia endosymbiont of Ixodes persulcatus]|nr:hypothetical protein [Rickettsia endosymbiont of Ixodes persulcatus]